ncbi:hypothetical protein Tco_1122877 [Tanacetum coccineum]|uniref:Uncharacterized protein n=1 Tax=Tanacetum coccineum TaxID=301880 RepID=A0ABQ5J1R6_9ASTR
MCGDDEEGRDPLEFLTWTNSKFKDKKKVDETTKRTLLHSRIEVGRNKGIMDDIVSSDDEWEESDYGNPPNTNDDSLLEPYSDAYDKKWNERNPVMSNGDTSDLGKTPHPNNVNDEQPNGGMCKTKKFEVIKYSLGPNEEYIALKNYGYNTWRRSKDSLSHIYQEIFQRRGEGWTVTRMDEE